MGAARALLRLLAAATLCAARARKRHVRPPITRCKKAISLYAMPKTGSTFLGRFSRDVALRQQMCKVYQNTKEFLCESVAFVDCPRNELHAKSVHLERAFARPLGEAAGDSRFSAWDCGPPEKVEKQWRCRRSVEAAADPARRQRCDHRLRHHMFVAANAWLRDGNLTSVNRYNLSLHSLLSARGFVRGPLRLLSTEYTARAVPYFAHYQNVVIVHTRHPVEMMVSVFYCIADPKVCPVRSKFLGNHVPVNDTIASLDKFVLGGVRREGSTPYLILQRSEILASFITAFRRDWRMATEGGTDQDARACGAPVLVHSKYEDMVSNYSSWARQLVGPLSGDADRPAQQNGLLATLLERYQNDFVPDGKHKHTLKMGGNIAKLKHSTVRHLMKNQRIRSTLRLLKYDWLGHDPSSIQN
ncbi:hypothetical protein AB1Y20_004713 [Prymnesium parvum]|uniref:Protein-tyrosine sulfotransferase n=1 Tax=Prymnesium parvum TaxID=97485 RepID=A0AB34IX17_PRYPA